MNDKAITCNTPEAVSMFRLLSLRGMVKMEARGMKMSRGVNATAAVRKELGLKARTPHADVLVALQGKIDELKNASATGIGEG